MTEPNTSAVPAGRDIAVLTTGARVALTVAGVFVVLAAALFWMPIEVRTPPAPPISCGCAASPSGDKAVVGLCGNKPRQQQLRAGAALATALVIAAGGIWAFGTRHERQEMVCDVPIQRELDEEPGPGT